jgi:hypothetical protein
VRWQSATGEWRCWWVSLYIKLSGQLRSERDAVELQKHFECRRSIEIDDCTNAKLDSPWTEFLVLRIEVWIEEVATGINTV